MDSQNIQDAIEDEIVEFANKMADANPDADLWDIADGLLAGVVHWWLYANAPCADPQCEDCASVQTAELRMKALEKLVREVAETSEYYHTPNDTNVARA